MPRCFISPGELEQTVCRLDSGDAHHLINVLRLRDGDQVTACDGAGRAAAAHLRIAGRKQASLERTGEIQSVPRFLPLIYICVAVPKGARMDLLIEKCTELGVHAIQPLIIQRSVAMKNESAKESRIVRWQRIAQAAAAQSGRAWLPQLLPPASLAQTITDTRQLDLRLCAALVPQAEEIRNTLQRSSRTPQSICIWIGPEGDFTAEEYKQIFDSGIMPVNLGPHTMRVETAAIAATAICAACRQ